jgi:hypothetical protein
MPIEIEYPGSSVVSFGGFCQAHVRTLFADGRAFLAGVQPVAADDRWIE